MTIINGVIKGKQPVIESLTVTPSTSAQTISAPTGTDGYGPVNVSAVTSSIDANIIPGNIKNGVPILGVTGDYTGGGPAYYIEKTNDNGTLVCGSNIMSLAGVSDIGPYALYYAYANNNQITGSFSLGNITSVTGERALANAFENSSLSGAVDFSSLTNSTGQRAFYHTFYWSNITSLDLSGLIIAGENASYNSNVFQGICLGCASLVSVDLSNLVEIKTSFSQAFSGANITNINLPKLKKINANFGASAMFERCPISSVNLNSLEEITPEAGNGLQGFLDRSTMYLSTLKFESLKILKGNGCMTSMCSSYNTQSILTNIYFYALDTDSFGDYTNQFSGMVHYITGCTVHFPMRIQSKIGSWSDVTNGFGGTNTTVLFDIVTSLTGSDTNIYVRQEKNSTGTATAWNLNDVLYYTSGTTEPVVGDTIYSDDTCTTAVTTVSSIA